MKRQAGPVHSRAGASANSASPPERVVPDHRFRSSHLSRNSTSWGSFRSVTMLYPMASSRVFAVASRSAGGTRPFSVRARTLRYMVWTLANCAFCSFVMWVRRAMLSIVAVKRNKQTSIPVTYLIMNPPDRNQGEPGKSVTGICIVPNNGCARKEGAPLLLGRSRTVSCGFMREGLPYCKGVNSRVRPGRVACTSNSPPPEGLPFLLNCLGSTRLSGSVRPWVRASLRLSVYRGSKRLRLKPGN